MLKKTFFAAVALAAVLPLAESCNNKGNDDISYTATVTLKNEDSNFYFKESETTAYVASNLSTTPVKGVPEKRMVLYYNSDNKPLLPGIPGFENTYSITVCAMDTVMTKKPVPTKGTEADDAVAFGNDRTALYLDGSGIFPFTCIEDGYLLVRCVFFHDINTSVVHSFNLVTGVNKSDPWEVELRHNAFGDNYGTEFTGYIAFPLKDIKDDKMTEKKKVTLVWNSGVTGEKERVTFEYMPRTDWPEDL